MADSDNVEHILYTDHILKIEAQEVVKEVAYAVNFVEISKVLQSAEQIVYLNLQTKEGDVFCVELSVSGFRIVSHQFDNIQEGSISRYFETIYALLDNVSPEYRNTFGDALFQKLLSLQSQQQEDNMKS